LRQLDALEAYIARKSTPCVAARYVDGIVARCEGLSIFPHRGNRRDDLKTGLRVTHHDGNAVIAFDVDPHARVVSIHGVFYGGWDYAAMGFAD
jgi:plasmid stabilization system protein ParE